MSFALTSAEEITIALDDLIASVAPEAGRRSMYGGTVFESEAGNHQTMVCGYFVYKQHVSLEFSNGYQLHDPNGVLEGKGKFRRHIKLRKLSDLAAKSAEDFLRQAFA